MRPSGITDGILSRTGSWSTPRRSGFNEAVGYYRRNPEQVTCSCEPRSIQGFNEAVGYYRRNPACCNVRSSVRDGDAHASMRPSGITDGISACCGSIARRNVMHYASMRPSGITDGIR